MVCKKKTAFIVSTPSGRSIISKIEDPNKAFHKTKTSASKKLKVAQKNFKVKLKVKKVRVPCRVSKFI